MVESAEWLASAAEEKGKDDPSVLGLDQGVGYEVINQHGKHRSDF
jgi:hypothetical protein